MSTSNQPSVGWRMLKKAHSIVTKMNRRVSSINFVGEDLKFAEDSMDNRLACALQIAIQKSNGKNNEQSSGCIKGASSTGPIECYQWDFKCCVEEWEPETFASIRSYHSVDPIEYKATLGLAESKEGPRKSTLRFVGAHDASGKSFSWFLFSPDMRYCCKTMNKDEAETLLQILPSYAEFCKTHTHTLLPHFLGLYSVNLPKKKIWVFVQSNVFASGLAITERYDLKGSYSGRRASAKEMRKGVHAVLKDEDFISRGRSLCCASADAVSQFKDILRADVSWLKSQGLMDYSLLVGLVRRDDAAAAGNHDRGARHTLLRLELTDPDFKFAVVGVVDILMRYNWFKRLENLALDPFLPGISCQPPRKYGDRMLALLDFAAHGPDGASVSQSAARAGWLRRARSRAAAAPEMGRKDFAMSRPWAAKALAAAAAAAAVAAVLAVVMRRART